MNNDTDTDDTDTDDTDTDDTDTAPTVNMNIIDLELIDLEFQGMKNVIALFVWDTGDGLAIVDTGPTSTLGTLEAGLKGMGASLSDLRHILLTHIHFDHAGATGTILERVPQARAYVHKRGAPHLSQPERLVASATQIYGDQMDRLWGEMKPIDPQRLTVLSGGETLNLGQQEAQAIYTPGHAAHHLAYHVGNDLFVGDVGGVRLAAQQTPRAPTPPPDINLEVWRESIATLREVQAKTLHLTHFGSYANTNAHWEDLLKAMNTDAQLVQAELQAGQTFETISERFSAALLADLDAQGEGLAALYDKACPPWMSVQGLMRYWTRKQARA